MPRLPLILVLLVCTTHTANGQAQPGGNTPAADLTPELTAQGIPGTGVVYRISMLSAGLGRAK